LRCQNNVVQANCGSDWYNLSNQRCENNVIETKCGSNWYDTSNSNLRCQSSVIETKCGDEWYNASNTNLRCQSDVVETKCGDGWYNASNSNLRCQSSVIETKCGSRWYNASNANLRCQSDVVETKCGDGWYNASNANLRCQSDVVETKCGTNDWYNSLTQFCHTDNTIHIICEGSSNYNVSTQYCSDGTLKNYGFVAYEGKTYKTVVIGTQTWMAENLNYAASGSKCYENQENNCNKYGRLYNWQTAMANSPRVCPSGWHLPSDAEWTTLTNYVDGLSSTAGINTAGIKLKAASGWNDYYGRSGNGTDDYGFSALPGGSGNSNGNFFGAGSYGFWWSATGNGDSYAYNRYMYYNDANLVRSNSGGMADLYSVRCVQ
jgi:uncharacterized protein (TIGR02145 family)